MEKNTKRLPTGQIFGFLFSLVLTFAAAGAALKTALPFQTIMWVIGSLAILQAGLQLFMFMHATEGEDGKTNVINIVYAIFTAVVIVAGTIWVMSFGMHH